MYKIVCNMYRTCYQHMFIGTNISKIYIDDVEACTYKIWLSDVTQIKFGVLVKIDQSSHRIWFSSENADLETST